MSNTNINTEKSFSTREDKIIKSTIVLYEDNEKKVKVINDLKFCLSKCDELECDEVFKTDLIKTLNDISNYIQESYKINQHHIRQVNPSAN